VDTIKTIMEYGSINVNSWIYYEVSLVLEDVYDYSLGEVNAHFQFY